MTVRDIDGDELLTRGADPFNDALGLGECDQRVNEDRFFLTGEQRNRTRRPGCLFDSVPFRQHAHGWFIRTNVDIELHHPRTAFRALPQETTWSSIVLTDASWCGKGLKTEKFS